MSEVTTREILERSLAAINAGLWTCGDMIICAEAPGDDQGNTMGCALGLVGLHSGVEWPVVEYEDYIFDPSTNEEVRITFAYPDVQYPHQGGWTDSALKAVDLLAETADVSDEVQSTAMNEATARHLAFKPAYNEALVYLTNDAKGMTAAKAADWFKRALAALDVE